MLGKNSNKELVKYTANLKSYWHKFEIEDNIKQNFENAFSILDQENIPDEQLMDAVEILYNSIDVLNPKDFALSGSNLILALYNFLNGNPDQALEDILNEMIINPDNELAYSFQDYINSLENTSLDMSYDVYKNAKQLLIENKEEEVSENLSELLLSMDDKNVEILHLDNMQDQSTNTIDDFYAINPAYQYKVSIIIPAFNNSKFTKQCLETIYQNSGTRVKYQIIVIDNASTDNTQSICEDFQINFDNFKYIKNPYNLGFAKACNQGIEKADGEHILLLNNDTLPRSGWLDSIVEEMREFESAGAIGACLLYPERFVKKSSANLSTIIGEQDAFVKDSDELIQHIWVTIGTENGKTIAPYHNQQFAKLSETPKAHFSREVSAVSGACMLIRREAIEKVGLFDELFINGLEDIDYCFRLKQEGFTIRYAADCKVVHYESLSEGRHQWDVDNWNRLNRKWANQIKFDETKEITLEESEKIKLRKSQLILSRELIENPIEIISNFDFSIIIVVHNNIEYTKQCIESIERQLSNFVYEIIVVNNASTDSTIDYLARNKEKLVCIHNFTNESFAKANNQAAKIAKGKYLIFLNNDTVVYQNWLDSLYHTFEKNEDIAIQGARLVYPDSTIQHCGIVWGKVKDDLNLHYHIYLKANEHDKHVNKAREFQMLTGAMLAVRKNVFDEIGGFDEKYHFGHEDLDLCLEARQRGYKVWYNPLFAAYHFESITKKTNGIENYERFITNPDSFDAKNHKYFLSKWENILEIDADKYYEEDGLYGLSSNNSLRKIFEIKIGDILDFVKKLILENKQEEISAILRILFNSDKFENLTNTAIVINVPIAKLEEAERYIDNIKNIENQNIKNNSNTNVFKELNTHNYSNKSNMTFDLNNQTNDIVRVKKVLITMFGWNESGGGTTFPKAIAKNLQSRAYEVAVFFAGAKLAESNAAYLIKEFEEDGLNLFGIFNRPSEFLDLENPHREVKDSIISTYFKKVLNQFKPDVIHFNNFLGLSFEIAEIAYQANIPTCYTPHNYHLIDPALYMMGSNLEKWKTTDPLTESEYILEQRNLRDLFVSRKNKALDLLNNKIDITLAVSERQKELFVEFGADPSKIKVINQINVNLRNINKKLENSKNNDNGLLKIIYFGAVIPQKGVHTLIASSQLLEENQAEIHIYGFASKSYLNNLANINTRIKVFYEGQYSEEQIPNILRNADVVVIPSIWEDCAPLAIAEALANNIPVIGPNIGGFGDFIVNNLNGYIYQYLDNLELGRILKDLAKNKEKIKQLKENCFIPYQFEDYLDYLEKLYSTLKYNKTSILELEELRFKSELLKQIAQTNKQEEKAVNQLVSSEMKLYDQNENPNSAVPVMNRLSLSEDLNHGFSNNKASGKMPTTLPNPLKINLGCGNDVKESFINIDLFSKDPRVVYGDIRKLDFHTGSVDYILASDVLEHFSHREVDSLLKEWARVLKPGGTIEIRCPNLRLQLQAYLRGDWNADIASYMIFGGQTNPGDYHCIGFDEISIRNHLALAGLEIFDYVEHDFPQDQGFINLNMTIKAKKLTIDDENFTQNSYNRQEPSDFEIFGANTSDLSYDEIINAGEQEKSLFLECPVYKDPEYFNPQINIVWEGSQLVYHSLALVNREHCYNILEGAQANLTIVPYEKEDFVPESNEKYQKLLGNDIRFKLEQAREITQLPYVWIRHQWPPKDEAPLGAKWIIMQPWEYTKITSAFVHLFNEADEIWTPSNYSRDAIVGSGVDFNKVQVIPNGIDPKLFTPNGDKYPLKTKKKIKLLYVGGTIPRKGIDILLSSYINTFIKADNICLVIKDMGGDSYYKGQTAISLIRDAQNNSTAPEIEYIDAKLSEEEIASLYRACDVFVSSYRAEGFSLPTLEAMACGLPVVVTKGGATDDFVDEEIGWQIPAEMVSIGSSIDTRQLAGEAFMLNPKEDALSQILKDIYQNPSSLINIGLLASHRARSQWTWNKATLKALTRIDALYGTTTAIESAKHLVDIEDAALLLGKAERFHSLQKFDQAKECYEKAIELGGLNSEYLLYTHHALIMMAIDAEEFENALNLLDTCDKIVENHPDTIYLRAKAFALTSNLVEALEIFTILVENWTEFKYITNLGLTLDHLLCYTGDLLAAMQDWDSAMQIYETALKLNDENAEAYLGLGLACKEKGDLHEATQHLEQALSLRPFLQEAKNALNEIYNN